MNKIYECLDNSCMYRTPEGSCMCEDISLDQEHHCMNYKPIIEEIEKGKL